MGKKDKPYLPDVRTGYAPSPDALVSQSPGSVDTCLTNTVEDPVVVNNIACNEFDYTEGADLDTEINTNP